jgi:hypothetical protein
VSHRSAEGCSAGLDFHSVSPENDGKIVSVPLNPDHSKNDYLQFVWMKIQVNMQVAPNTPVRHASRLSVQTCRSPRTAADRRQHSGNVLGCAKRGQPRPGGFLHATEPSSRHGLTHRLIVFRDGATCSHFIAKSALQLYNGHSPNKQFHATHTFCYSPTLHVD